MKNLLKKTRKTWENAWKKLYIPTHPINQQVFCFPKTWHGTSPPHLSGNNINYTWTYMNYERFYSHNYNHNYINKDFMKKGLHDLQFQVVFWKVSCYFFRRGPFANGQRFLGSVIFPGGFSATLLNLYHENRLWRARGLGKRRLGTGCIAFNFAHLPRSSWLVLWGAYRIL